MFPLTRLRQIRRLQSPLALASLFGFFGTKVGVGLIVTVASAQWLAPAEFAFFTQLLLFAAWLNLVATGGTVNGLVQQIAALGNDVAGTSRIVAAAVRIWLAILLLLFAASIALREQISVLLVGNGDAAAAIPVLTLLSGFAGLNQLLCSVLTATRRAAASMTIQALGLLISGAGAAWFLLDGRPAEAVLAFASGPAATLLLTVPNTAWALGGLLGRVGWSDVRRLTGHSLAFFAVATLPPALLFGARSVYQEAFSPAVLAYWLLANRISDLNTQVVGIYNVQFALPRLSAARSHDDTAAALKASLITVAAFGAGPFLAFLLLGRWALSIAFPPAYLAAAPFIEGYLLGDFFRGIVSVAMMWALARNRLFVYAGIEMAIMAVVTLAIIVGAWSAVPIVPAIGYPLVYAAGALAFAATLYRWRNRAIAESRRTGPEQGSPLQGDAAMRRAPEGEVRALPQSGVHDG